jgi:hypothetical protein
VTTLDQVRLGYVTRLGTITNPQDGGLVKAWGIVPDAFDPPAIFVSPPTIPSYFGDLDTRWFEVTFDLAVMVSSASDDNQLQLIPFMERSGPQSIFATIMADTSLGGLNVEAKPVSARPLGKTEIGNVMYFGAAVTSNVIVGE